MRTFLHSIGLVYVSSNYQATIVCHAFESVLKHALSGLACYLEKKDQFFCISENFTFQITAYGVSETNLYLKSYIKLKSDRPHPQWWRDLFRCRIDLLNFSMGFNIVTPYMVCVTHKWISPSLSLQLSAHALLITDKQTNNDLPLLQIWWQSRHTNGWTDGQTGRRDIPDTESRPATPNDELPDYYQPPTPPQDRPD